VFGVAGVRIAAISRDSPYSHKKYAEQQWLDYPLLTDWTGEAVRAFGVAQELDGLVDTPVRSCFLIGGDGVILEAWRYDDDEVPDVEELARAAVSLGNE
jgi:peroxiredoxin Q/BCP